MDELESLIEELQGEAGELMFEVEIEEEEYFRIVLLSLFIDPEKDILITNIMFDVQIPKEVEVFE